MKKHTKRTVSIVLALILSLQLILLSGLAAFASGAPEMPEVNPKIQIKGVSLALRGEIELIFHFDVPSNYPDSYVEVFKYDDDRGGKYDTVKKNTADCTPLDDNWLYTVAYPLSAVELSEEIYLEIFDNAGTPLAQAGYSAEEYAKTLLDSEKATDKEKEVARTLVNYGHYAQLACGEANGWSVGDKYPETAAIGALKTDPSVFENDEYDIKWSTRTGSFDTFSMSLELDYKTGMRLYIPLEDAPDTVTVNGKNTQAKKSTRVAGTYEVFIGGINALNLADEYTVVIDEVEFCLCAFSYCKLAVRSAKKQSTVNAMCALYEFHKATDRYLNPTQGVKA